MLDRSKKKAPVNAPKSLDGVFPNTVLPWEQVFQDIFEPCLTFPPGNIYSKQGIQISAGRLVEMIEQLSYLQLTSYEVKDVKNFIDFYRVFLENMDRGPGGPNGWKSRVLKSADPQHEVFARAGRNLMDSLETQIRKIEQDSKLAENLHETYDDVSPYPGHPKMKAAISISGKLADAVEDLRSISKGQKITLPETSRNDLHPNNPTRQGPTGGLSSRSSHSVDLAS